MPGESFWAVTEASRRNERISFPPPIPPPAPSRMLMCRASSGTFRAMPSVPSPLPLWLGPSSRQTRPGHRATRRLHGVAVLDSRLEGRLPRSSATSDPQHLHDLVAVVVD